MSTRSWRSLTAIAALPLLFTGCAALSDGDDTGATDAEGGTADGSVVASFYPLQYLTQRVAGDVYDVENLTRPGYEPHDLDLSIAETATVADAALVVYLSQFQPAVDDAVANNAAGRTLDLAEHLELLPASGEDDHGHGHEEEHAEEEHAEEHVDEHGTDEHGHAEEHAHEEESAHEEEAHDHGDEDPHFWLDPLRMAEAAEAIATELGELAPEHAGEFTDNAATLRTDLEELDAEYAEGLSGCRTSTVVVNHNAFAYLSRYGLEFESITGLSPDSEPTAAVLSHLHEVVTEHDVTTVFAETLASPKHAESLAGDLGIETAVLDPIEGLTEETGEEDYLSLMRTNLQALAKANGC